jgi:predicted MFS family arabinose efflux permease
MSIFRRVGSVLFGLVVGTVVIMAVESLGQRLFPPPPNMDLKDLANLVATMSRVQPGALVMVLVGWALGSFAGGWAAARMAGRDEVRQALLVGAVLMAAGVANFFVIPHPVWMVVLGLAVYLPFAWMGGRLRATGAEVERERAAAKPEVAPSS